MKDKHALPKEVNFSYSDVPHKPLLRRQAQSRLESVFETAANTFSGFAVSWAAYQYIVIPYRSFFAEYGEAFWITVLFTVISLIRSYVWRRFFNADLHRWLHKKLRRNA